MYCKPFVAFIIGTIFENYQNLNLFVVQHKFYFNTYFWVLSVANTMCFINKTYKVMKTLKLYILLKNG